MKLILFAISIVLLIPVSGQKTISFFEADTATYGAYLRGDWEKMIFIGINAVSNDIDFYYLRMRIGYAYFMKHQYRKAIPHYQKALEFNKHDPTALEYLYYCYKYGDRPLDAKKLSGEFNLALLKHLNIDPKKSFIDANMFLSYAGGITDIKNDILQTAPPDIDGIQKLPESYMQLSFDMKHRFGNSIAINHSIRLFSKNEFAYGVINSLPYTSEVQTLDQYGYNLNMAIIPMMGFTIKPGFSVIHYRIPIYTTYGTGIGKDREIKEYSTSNNYVASIQAIKDFGLFRLSISGSGSNLNQLRQITGGLSFTVYPFGNLNLYYTGLAFLHEQKFNQTSDLQFIHSHRLGFKIFKYLWLDISETRGPFNNFYDSFSELVYNSLETHNRISGATLIIPLYRPEISIYMAYNYYQSESIFVPENDPLNPLNTKKFNYQTITGGIQWKF
jgi:hypothetical protein